MNYYKEQEKYKQAKKEIKKVKSFYIHITVYLIINILMAIQTFIHNGVDEMINNLLGFGLFWGIGIFFHWFSIFGKNLILSKQWEKRKIKEIMDENTLL